MTEDCDLLVCFGRINRTSHLNLVLVSLPPAWLSFSLSLVYASASPPVSSWPIAASRFQFRSAAKVKHHIKWRRESEKSERDNESN